MATLLDDGTWEIQGTRLTFPVRIGDAAAACALYAVPAARVVLPAGLAPRTLGRWTLAAVAALDYRVNDLGEYRELALAFPVRRGRRAGIHITQLPVTAEFTMEAGRALWGLPKWLGTADVTVAGPRAGAVLAHAGREVLALAVRAALPVPGTLRGAVTAFGLRDSTLLASPVRARATGVRLGATGVLRIGGGHPMADELRALDLGRPLATVIVDHLAFDMLPSGAA